HTRSTKYPMAVLTFSRSPVVTPSRAASLGCTHRGLVCEISASHFEFPERVWISVGRRNVGSRTISPRLASMFEKCTWLRMYWGTACSGHFHCLSVFEKNSSLRDGVGKPARAT